MARQYRSALDLGSNKITSLSDPTSAQDAATKNYVDSAASTTGWFSDANTWKYASANGYTVPGDATGYLPITTKVSLNDGSVKYAQVTASANSGVSLTGVASTVGTSLFTKTAHGLTGFGPVVISGLSNTTGVTNGTVYWPVTITTNTFQLANTFNGTPITLGGTADSSIVLSTATAVTVGAQTDSSFSNATFSAPRYSYAEAPQGFPTDFYEIRTGPAAGKVVGTETLTSPILTTPVINGQPTGTNLLASQYMPPTTPIAQTCDLGHLPGAVVGPLVSAQLYLVAVELYSGTVVGHIGCQSGTIAAGTPLNWWFGLYDNNRVQLAVTADQTTTAWATNTEKSLAIATVAAGAASSFTTTYTGLHYIGVMVKATTVPNFYGIIASSGIGVQLTPALCGRSTTGLTAPPAFPTTAAAISGGYGSMIYAWVAA